MTNENNQSSDDLEPLVSYRRMFEREVHQAAVEMQRPLLALFMSGLTAGLSMGLSMLFVLVLTSHSVDQLPAVVASLLMGSAYTIGFIVTIMSHTDLFTEYTTVALFPVLTGHAPLRKLIRLWAAVYAGNLLGGAVFAALIVVLGPALQIIQWEAFGTVARGLVDYPWWVVLLSGLLAGWLMGMLSWLIAGGRETISQIAFIWMITFVIGIAHLHHAVVGAMEVLAGILAGQGLTFGQLAFFLFWTSLGNAVGGVLFALAMQASVRVSEEEQKSDEGEGARRRTERRDDGRQDRSAAGQRRARRAEMD